MVKNAVICFCSWQLEGVNEEKKLTHTGVLIYCLIIALLISVCGGGASSSSTFIILITDLYIIEMK